MNGMQLSPPNLPLNWRGGNACRRAGFLARLAIIVVLLGLSVQRLGAGLPNNIEDWKDEGCDKRPRGAGSPPYGGCPPCQGMATWWVSEPYINLWVADEPLSYTMGSGETMSFRWTYKQRFYKPTPIPSTITPLKGQVLGLTNASWTHSWYSYIYFWDADWEDGHPFGQSRPDYVSWQAALFTPEGGVRVYSHGDENESRSRQRLEPIRGPSAVPYSYFDSGGDLTNSMATNGFRLIHPDGSVDIYNLVFKDFIDPPMPPNPLDSGARAFLTYRVDRHGRTNRIFWAFGSTPLGHRVSVVVDYEGRTNIFRYGLTNIFSGVFPTAVTEIEDPWGRKALFKYDSVGRLTNIADTAALSSSFFYESSPAQPPPDPNYPSNLGFLLTPYGLTAFNYFEDTSTTNGIDQGNFGGHNRVNRRIDITEPNGSRQRYLYRYDSPDLLPMSFPTNQVPQGGIDPDNGTATSGEFLASLGFRNSFHWGRKQMVAINNGTAQTSNNLFHARWRHWLQLDTNTVSDQLSLEREPTPDGVTPGRVMWYDYDAKSVPHRLYTGGDWPYHLSYMGEALPEGTTRSTTYSYGSFPDFAPWPLGVTSTYTGNNGAVSNRTWSYVYHANGIDLDRVIPPHHSYEQFKAAFAWTNNHLPTSVTNGAFEATLFTHYNANFDLERTLSPRGFETLFTHFSSGPDKWFPSSMQQTAIGRSQWLAPTPGRAAMCPGRRCRFA